ncbi:MAG: type 1 glutamine amidotransferase [Pseudoclavibacter sp.]
MRPVLITIHEEPEQPGLVAEALSAAGVPFEVRNVIEHPEAVPDPGDVSRLAGLVILGGPMAADETVRYPGLQREADLGLAAVQEDIPVLGVCLGHQIVGRALGGEFRPASAHELGVLDVDVVGSDPLLPAGGTIPAMLWHHDQIGLPPGATLLARNGRVPVQAFRCGSAVGVQFHIELDRALLDRWLAASPVSAELTEERRRWIRTDFARREPELHAYVRPGLAAWAQQLEP